MKVRFNNKITTSKLLIKNDRNFEKQQEFARKYKRLFRGIAGRLSWKELAKHTNAVKAKPGKKAVKNTLQPA